VLQGGRFSGSLLKLAKLADWTGNGRLQDF
jgi:hypothetical protein